ncbi:uncharacterized protein ISCGN_003145 [Ixodes scapularis]
MELYNQWLILGSLLVLGVLLAGPARSIRITRLSVPTFVKNGTESVVLDCEYELDSDPTDRQGLVVKWFLDDDPVPLYQWIPEISVGRHVGPKLRNRLDLFFSVPNGTDLNKFRALKIVRPTTELSGIYTCQVSSLVGQESRSGNMTVYAKTTARNILKSLVNGEDIDVDDSSGDKFIDEVLSIRHAQELANSNDQDAEVSDQDEEPEGDGDSLAAQMSTRDDGSWRKFLYNNQDLPFTEEFPVPEDVNSPLVYFSQFITREMMKIVAEQTNTYSHQK